jgi:uncharacterized membrane protein YvbJ
MNKICKICGHNGENIWRDGKYYCAACGSEVDGTRQDSNTNGSSSTETIINAVCPICKNANNNTLRDDKCHCALCGTLFDFNQQAYNPQSDITAQNANYIATKREELEKKKNNKLVWGIVWLFLFWPVSIYHFCKMYQISQEISNLTNQ